MEGTVKIPNEKPMSVEADINGGAWVGGGREEEEENKGHPFKYPSGDITTECNRPCVA